MLMNILIRILIKQSTKILEKATDRKAFSLVFIPLSFRDQYQRVARKQLTNSF